MGQSTTLMAQPACNHDANQVWRPQEAHLFGPLARLDSVGVAGETNR